jgi:hypothetical protein
VACPEKDWSEKPDPQPAGHALIFISLVDEYYLKHGAKISTE